MNVTSKPVPLLYKIWDMKNLLVLVCVVGLPFYVLSQSYYQWVERADSCIKAKDWAGAESALVSALRTEPANGQNSLLMSNLGTVQRYAGNYDAALRSYTNGLLMTPHSVTLLRNRAAPVSYTHLTLPTKRIV